MSNPQSAKQDNSYGFFHFLFQREKDEKVKKAEHFAYYSSLTPSILVGSVMAIFELIFFVATFINPEIYCSYLLHYRISYITLLVLCIIHIILSTEMKSGKLNDVVTMIKWNAFATFILLAWALTITRLDQLANGAISPILFMTFPVCIPACMYVTPKAYMIEDIIGNALMIFFMLQNKTLPDVYDDVINYSIFFFIQFLVAETFLYTRFKYYYTLQEQVTAEVETEQTKKLLDQTTRALALTIDAKDKYTNGHSIRVAEYSRKIANKMGLSETEQEHTYYMGLLHDVGKIGVPVEIIHKTSKLTDEEYEKIKEHPNTGYEILKTITIMPELAEGALYHHEKYDGTGYPNGRKGEEIPLKARIIGVADAYDAMTSKRSYRDTLPQNVVRKEIIGGKNTQFDPKISDIMVQMIDEDTLYTMHE